VGKPRVAVLSIAHLSDKERMFFVSLLLNQTIGWMRAKPGTTSLRAILCMDEVFGYMPPVAEPPSKRPMLTLLKQARAYGLGLLLATQNPVDLDYKGLSNVGTWLLGRLQTDRDKQRLLDGLEGAAAGTLDRADADRMLSALDKRVFLLHDVHASGPTVFQTRWTLSYLRGPLSRDQIRRLTVDRQPAGATHRVAPQAGAAASAPSAGAAGAPSPASAPAAGERRPSSAERPVVPPGIEQFFDPAPAGNSAPRYSPVVLGSAMVAFSDAKSGIDESRDVLYAADVSDGAVPVDWTRASRVDVPVASLLRSTSDAASLEPVPAPALQPRNYPAWQKAFGRWLAQAETLELFRHRDLKLTSRPGESERDFRIRVTDASRAARDEAVDGVRRKYAAKQAQLAERLRRAEAAVDRETDQASQAKLQTMLSVGATVLGALLGRKTISASTLGRATTAARGVGRSMKESEDIKRAGESAEAVRSQINDLDAQVLAETKQIAARYESDPEIERISLTPKRGQVSVQFVALGWMPEGM
jgi:hypothetical protein